MKHRTLGPWQISAIGIGCMNPSWPGGSALDPLSRAESAIPALHAALDAGVTLLDTADIYAPSWNTIGHNERFVAEALRSWSGSAEQKSKVVIATKAGIARRPGEVWGAKLELGLPASSGRGFRGKTWSVKNSTLAASPFGSFD